ARAGHMRPPAAWIPTRWAPARLDFFQLASKTPRVKDGHLTSRRQRVQRRPALGHAALAERMQRTRPRGDDAAVIEARRRSRREVAAKQRNVSRLCRRRAETAALPNALRIHRELIEVTLFCGVAEPVLRIREKRNLLRRADAEQVALD